MFFCVHQYFIEITFVMVVNLPKIKLFQSDNNFAGQFFSFPFSESTCLFI